MFETFKRFGREQPVQGYSTKTSARDFRVKSGTVNPSAGYPMGMFRKARSLAGRPKASAKKPMGEGVWVRATSPMRCKGRQQHAHGNAHALVDVVVGALPAFFLGCRALA